MTANIKGFKQYCKFIIKREKIISFAWIVSMVIFNTIIALSYTRLFENDEGIRSMVATLSTPQMESMMGPVYGPPVNELTLDNTMIVFAEEMLIWMMIASAVMNIFFINRHTRTDEELGRLEMFRSLPVGRLTGAFSALICALGVNIAMSVLMTFGMIAANVAGTTVTGAFIYSFAIGGIGFLFACITLLTAQLFESSRSSSMWAFITFGIFYIIRMYGDMAGNDTANYISPLGLGLRVYSFWENNPVPLLVILIESVIISTVALFICDKRDLGEGVVPTKAGRKNATAFLQNPLGLSWRLTRNTVITWIIVMFVMGAAYGAVLGQLADIVVNSEMFGNIVTGQDAGLATLINTIRDANNLEETINNDTNLKQKLDNFINSDDKLNQQLENIVNSNDTTDQKMAESVVLESGLKSKLLEIFSGNSEITQKLENTSFLSIFICSPEFKQQTIDELSKPLAQAFVAVMFIIMALLATVPIISMANKIHSEEKRGRIEPIFARSVSRRSMFGSYILIGAVESIVLMICAVIGLYSASFSMGYVNFVDLMKCALMYVPSIWVMMSIGILLVGFLPKLANLNWVLFAYSFIVVYFGRLIQMPEWTEKTTSYGNIPQYVDMINGNDIHIYPVFILTAVAIVLTTAGIYGFQKRDIE